MRAYIGMYIYTYIHTHIHTYIHAYINSFVHPRFPIHLYIHSSIQSFIVHWFTRLFIWLFHISATSGLDWNDWIKVAIDERLVKTELDEDDEEFTRPKSLLSMSNSCYQSPPQSHYSQDYRLRLHQLELHAIIHKLCVTITWPLTSYMLQ